MATTPTHRRKVETVLVTRLTNHLRKLPALKTISTVELQELQWDVKERVFMALFAQLAPAAAVTFGSIVAQRAQPSALSPAAAAVQETAFRSIFAKLVAKHARGVSSPEFPCPLASHTDLLDESKRVETLTLMDFLVDVMRKRNGSAPGSPQLSFPPIGRGANTPTTPVATAKPLQIGVKPTLSIVPSEARAVHLADVADNADSGDALADPPLAPPPAFASPPAPAAMAADSSMTSATSAIGRMNESAVAPRRAAAPVEPVTVPAAAAASATSMAQSTHATAATHGDSPSPPKQPPRRRSVPLPAFAQEKLVGPPVPRLAVSANNADVASLQLQLSDAQRDVQRVEAELEHVCSLYDQLVLEKKSELFTERRVDLLKAQNIQLERQILLQADALESRSTILVSLENFLADLRSSFEQWVAKSGAKQSVEVATANLQQMVAKFATIQRHLLSVHTQTDPERLSLPFLFMTSFASEHVTMLDVCSATTKHLNLRHVSRLEGKLCRLFVVLERLAATLETLSSGAQPQHGIAPLASPYISQEVRAHVTAALQESIKSARSCAHDLLSLSVLLPAAPLPSLDHFHVSGPSLPVLVVSLCIAVFCAELLLIKQGDVMARLPPGVQKNSSVRTVVDELLKSVKHHMTLIEAQQRAVQSELDFHRRCYATHVDCADGLFAAVEQAYDSLETRMRDSLDSPLAAILTAFDRMKSAGTEASLREFLLAFKGNVGALQELQELLSEPRRAPAVNVGSGVGVVRRLRAAFFERLAELQACNGPAESAGAHATNEHGTCPPPSYGDQREGVATGPYFDDDDTPAATAADDNDRTVYSKQ